MTAIEGAEASPRSRIHSERYSVLISVYVKENVNNLRACLDSVLVQSVPPDEVLVVKDGFLTSELEEALDDYSESYPGLFTFVSYQENRGLWYALGVGVPACRNELIMRMDTDDLSVPERAERQLALLVEHPEVGCVGSLVMEFEGDMHHPTSLVKLPEFHDEIVRFGKRRCPFRHPSLMYRKSVVMKAGNYREMPLFEDYDLYMRLASSGCVLHNIQTSLVWMRVGDDFFARRGSFDYLRKMLHFKTVCLKRGDLGFGEFLISTVPHCLVCLMPNRVRAWVYKKFLRDPVSPTNEAIATSWA